MGVEFRLEMWLWGLDFWDVVMGVWFGFVMWLWWVWIWDVGEEKGEKMWEKFAGLLCSSRIWVQIFFFFIFLFSFFFAKAGMVFYERRSEGLKNWRLDQGRVRWSEAGSLTEILYGFLTKCSGMGPTKIRKYWVMRSWKYVQNGWGIKIEWRVKSDEWWVMEKKKKKPNNPLTLWLQMVGVCLCATALSLVFSF